METSISSEALSQLGAEKIAFPPKPLNIIIYNLIITFLGNRVLQPDGHTEGH